MSVKQKLARIPILRRVVIKALKAVEHDVSITNQWTGNALTLNSFRHKSYWYFGQERERETMVMFAKLIREGDAVIEAGGHIGYITQYFSKLVGPRGRVVVFEPGSNNARYIEENVRTLRNVSLVLAAVSSQNGRATFYEDNLTGQNNSLLSNYTGTESTAKSHGEKLACTPHEVEVLTIDSYVADHGLAPDFMKIDVEGCEYDVLLGAAETLRNVRALMVEVTMQSESVARILNDAGFKVIKNDGSNLFAIRTE